MSRQTQTVLFRIALTCVFAASACMQTTIHSADSSVEELTESDGDEFARIVTREAKSVADNQVRYDASYVRLMYPAGDPPVDRGACTDLLIRAYRAAGVDPQKEIHEDRKERPDAYPSASEDERRIDSNIDHRRCRNLIPWFRKNATLRPDARSASRLGHYEDWRAGDVVFLNFIERRKGRPDHVGIVSGDNAPDGTPYIYDLFPPRARKRRVDDFPIPMALNSRYRWPEKQPAGPPIMARRLEDQTDDQAKVSNDK